MAFGTLAPDLGGPASYLVLGCRRLVVWAPHIGNVSWQVAPGEPNLIRSANSGPPQCRPVALIVTLNQQMLVRATESRGTIGMIIGTMSQ